MPLKSWAPTRLLILVEDLPPDVVAEVQEGLSHEEREHSCGRQ